MTKNIKELIEIIINDQLTEKVEQLRPILKTDPNIIHAEISNDILRSVTSKYSTSTNNITLLHVAAMWNCEEVARFLIEEGADVNAISDDVFQNTPLHEAAGYGSKEVAELLLKHGANIESKDHFGNTPLHKASNRGYDAVVELLLDKGANVDAVTSDYSGHRETSLHKAITNSHMDNYLNIVKMLLDYGANTEIEDLNNGTPLYQAVGSSQIKAIKLLLDAKADVNSRNKRGETPLHIVVNYGLDSLSQKRCDVAELLLKNGADVHAKDENGNTPLHNAAFHRSEGVARLFLKYGANIDETNKYGTTPLKRAACGILFLPIGSQPDREPIVRFLTEQTEKKSHSINGKGDPVSSCVSDTGVEKHDRCVIL
ncbi:ankyrin repeat domain-containing protein [Wolbachia endosymbiont (group E) of Neria commutata]|uniref:ankyrin repeat domain-containing protein n=1 Tax=Wolbachia endosymbiont (group E) of Neria commutata TaxID=3066149 RepID=UPI0031331C51